MPQVPRYNQPTVQNQPLPNARATVRATPEAFGAGVGDVGEKFFQNMVQQEAEKADEIAVMSARRRLTEYQNKKLYDPKDGALNRRGRDSFGLPEETLPDFDNKISEIEGELSDRQRRVFRRIAEQSRAQLDETVQRHVFQERQKYDTEETNSFVATERESAVFNFRDPGRIESGIQNQISAINEYARRNGKGADWVKDQVEDAKSKTYLAVIKRALAEGDDRYASALYEEIKADIKSDEQVEAAKLVGDGKYVGASQRTADQIIGEHKIDRAGAQEAIKKIEDPKLRDMVQQRVDQHYTRQKMIEAETREEAFEYATRLADSGQPIPATIRNALSMQQLTALDQYLRRKAKGEDVDTDWSVYYKLQRDAFTDMNAFAKLDLMQYRPKLGDVEFKEIVGLQRAIRKGDAAEQEKLNGYRTAHQIVDDSLEAVGINPRAKDGTDDAKQVAQFRRLVDEQVLLFQTQNGRKANSVEVQAIVDNLLVKGKVPGTGVFGWFMKEKRVYQLDPTKQENLVVKVDEIPLVERRKIEAALARQGKKTSDPDYNDEMVRLYNLKARSLVAK